MSSEKRPQYKPTPELQNVTDAIAPSVRQSLQLGNVDVVLRCFSSYPDNKNKFTFFLDIENKVFKAEIEQKIESDGKVKIQLLQLFELKNK